MKKVVTIFLVAFSFLSSFAQGPVIEGTYLPVRGTAVKEVWDTVPGSLFVPYPGQDTIWDYSGLNGYFTDTFVIATFHPDSTPNQYHQYFPEATHASYLRTPFNNLSDSLYSYYIIDTAGLHMIGGFNVKVPVGNTYVGLDTTSIINPKELYVPNIATYGMTLTNVSNYITYGKYNGMPIQIRGAKTKILSGIGYGTLITPNGSVFTNVLLTKIQISTIDSVFMSGSYTGISSPQNYIDYSFIANNTFGSSSLMYFNVDAANTIVNSGWYTLPVDFGYIAGTVYDSLNEANIVPHGEAYLYRENSNFAKNDILDKSPLDSLGNFKFDSIPYGEYRIAIRPDLQYYPDALTTYYGDSTDWLSAPSITTMNDSSSDGHKIHLQYHPTPNGLGQIHGNLKLDLSIRANNPIPGVDVVVKKKPGGAAFHEDKTDSGGDYDIAGLEDGDYELFVDIPGLHMSGTYDITILGSTSITCLDYTSGTDSIHPVCQPVGIKEERFKSNAGLIQAYPNPFSEFTTIKVDVLEKSDVVLEVFNILGEKIQILDKGQKQAGTYSYSFNAKKLNYSSGIYFIKLTTDNKTDVLRIVEQ